MICHPVLGGFGTLGFEPAGGSGSPLTLARLFCCRGGKRERVNHRVVRGSYRPGRRRCAQNIPPLPHPISPVVVVQQQPQLSLCPPGRCVVGPWLLSALFSPLSLACFLLLTSYFLLFNGRRGRAEGRGRVTRARHDANPGFPECTCPSPCHLLG